MAVVRKPKVAAASPRAAGKAPRAVQSEPVSGINFDEASGLVTLLQSEYVKLLINASVTEAKRWPKALRKGARLLATIRRIEAECIKKHGAFDWEKLDRDTQDQYDGTCADLTILTSDPAEPRMSLAELARKYGLDKSSARK